MRKRVFRFPWRSGADIDRDLDDEILFHMELRVAELERSGLTPAEARREAERQFGDVEDARLYCKALAMEQERAERRSHKMEAVVQDVGYTLRQIRRSPAFAVGTVAVLSVAMAITVVCFVFVRAYLLRPLPVPAPDRLVWLIPGPSRESEVRPPDGFFTLDWTAADEQFETTVAWDLDGFTLVGGTSSEYVDGAWVSPGFTEAILVTAERGRLFEPDDYRGGAQVALISHALWQRRYNGDPNVVGTTLIAHSTDRPNDPVSATIIGVLPEQLWHFNRFTDVLLPLSGPRLPTLAVLRPGDSAEQAAARLTTWVKTQLPQAAPAWRMSMVSAHDEYVHQIRPALRVAFGACLLLLLIACVNVAGLVLTRTVVRRHELAVRTAIGAGKGRIVRQVVTESLVLATAAALIALGVAQVALGSVRALVETVLRTPVPGGAGSAGLDGTTLMLLTGLATVAALFLGVGPALLASRFQLGEGLTGGRWSTGGRKGSSLRGAFVAAQLASCLALLAGSATLARAAIELRNQPLGFEAGGVLKAHVLLPRLRYTDGPQRILAVDEILANVARAPGVQGMAMAFPHPFRPRGTQPVQRPDQTAQDAVPTMPHVVAGDYFGVMQIPLLDGRLFDTRDRADAAPVALVSAALAARLWPTGSPVGRLVRMGTAVDSPALTVIGVVGDARNTLVAENAPNVYLPYAQSPLAYMALLARGESDAMSVATAVQSAVWQLDRDLPLSDVGPLADVISAQTAGHRFLSGLTGVLSGFALLLALLGLYATISYDVTQRTREFAIRMVVGAHKQEPYRLVLQRGGKLAVIGVAAGALLSALVTRAVATQVPAVRALGAMPQIVLAAGLVILTAVALLAPARRAARVNPASLLRD